MHFPVSWPQPAYSTSIAKAQCARMIATFQCVAEAQEALINFVVVNGEGIDQ